MYCYDLWMTALLLWPKTSDKPSISQQFFVLKVLKLYIFLWCVNFVLLIIETLDHCIISFVLGSKRKKKLKILNATFFYI